MTPTSKIAESRRKSGVRWTPLVAAWKSPMRGSVHRAVAGSRIHYLLWAREPAAPGERRRDGQFADSPLERDGFELSVPREYEPDKRGRGTESLQTPRWREPDSNHRSRREGDGRGERPHRRPSSSRETTKQGISSIELGRRLGVSQTTAWKVKHKLKQVMIERDATKKLTGRIEIDDAYLGGEHSGGKRGRGAAGKQTTADGKPVSLKLGRVSGFSSNVLSGFAKHIRSIVSGGQRWPGLLQQRNRCRMHPPGH